MDLLKLNKELKKAVFDQNLEGVAYLLENGADASYRVNTDAGNLLHHTNNVEIATMLIDKGAKVNARNRYRKTPLHIAVENNNSELVSLLLKNGASMSDVEILSKMNPLSIAILKNNFTIVKILIEFGCNIHEPMNLFLDNTLHLALKSDDINLEMILYLLGKGADATVIDFEHNYPIHLALKSKDCSSALISKLVKCGADINCKDKVGNSPLHYVVGSGNADLLKTVLKHSPIMNTFNYHGINPLQIALRQCVELDVIQLLLSYGCNTNVFDINFSHDCVPIDIVNSLQSRNIVNVCDKYGYTPLHLAVGNIKFLNLDIIKELLQYGASTKDIALFAVKVKEQFYDISTFYSFQMHALKNKIEPKNSDTIMNDVFKLLVEYSVINHDVEEYSDIDLFENSIKVYMNLCQTEISLLEEELGVSLLELSVVKNATDTLPLNLLNKMIEVSTGKKFPIYKHFIQARFKRSGLLNMLMKQNIAVNDGNTPKLISLDWASISHLAKYLTNSDLLNLTAAYFTLSNIISKCIINKKNMFTQHLLCHLYAEDNIQLIMCSNDDISMHNNYYYGKKPFKLFDSRCVPSSYKLLGIKDVINKDTNLNVFESCHCSLLLNAIQECKPVEIVECLLKLGANIFAVTKKSFDNALHLALQRIHSSTLIIVKVLLKYASKADDICNYAERTKAMPVQIVRSLKSGLFVNIVNANGDTPLHFVLQHSFNNNMVDIIMELLLCGGDPTSMNNVGRNPVFYLAKRVQEIPPTEINQIDIAKEIVKLFIKFGVINSNFNVQIFSPLNSTFDDSFVSHFALDCQLELSFLEKETISDIHFENSKTCKNKDGKCVLSHMMDRIFEICDRHEYPIYEDLLVSKIHRLDLLKLLSKLVLAKLSYPRKNNLAIVSVLPYITQYLNKQDLLRWVIAFALQSSLKVPSSKCSSLKRSICDLSSKGNYTVPTKTKKFSSN